MNYEAVSFKYYDLICILVSVIKHAYYIFSVQHHIVTRGLSACTVSFHIFL